MLFIKNDAFTKKEQLGLQKARFLAKERERLITNNDLKFNGRVIYTEGIGITLIQVRQCKNLKTVNGKNTIIINNKGIIRQNLTIKD
jgi:hypothetical protein